jgi:hypothetical protein
MWMSASSAEKRLRNFIFDAYEDNRAIFNTSAEPKA